MSYSIADVALEQSRVALEIGLAHVPCDTEDVTWFIELFRRDFERELPAKEGPTIWRTARRNILPLARAIGAFAAFLAVNNATSSAKVSRAHLWEAFDLLAPRCTFAPAANDNLTYRFKKFCESARAESPSFPSKSATSGHTKSDIRN